MKNICILMLLIGVILLAGCYSDENKLYDSDIDNYNIELDEDYEKDKKQKVTCSICNGGRQVKYYYGEDENDYNMGPCTSCDGNGYIMIEPSGDNDDGDKVICGSCEEYVEKIITKEDAVGENRTWCAKCWEEYDYIMGR